MRRRHSTLAAILALAASQGNAHDFDRSRNDMADLCGAAFGTDISQVSKYYLTIAQEYYDEGELVLLMEWINRSAILFKKVTHMRPSEVPKLQAEFRRHGGPVGVSALNLLNFYAEGGKMDVTTDKAKFLRFASQKEERGDYECAIQALAWGQSGESEKDSLRVYETAIREGKTEGTPMLYAEDFVKGMRDAGWTPRPFMHQPPIENAWPYIETVAQVEEAVGVARPGILSRFWSRLSEAFSSDPSAGNLDTVVNKGDMVRMGAKPAGNLTELVKEASTVLRHWKKKDPLPALRLYDEEEQSVSIGNVVFESHWRDLLEAYDHELVATIQRKGPQTGSILHESLLDGLVCFPLSPEKIVGYEITLKNGSGASRTLDQWPNEAKIAADAILGWGINWMDKNIGAPVMEEIGIEAKLFDSTVDWFNKQQLKRFNSLAERLQSKFPNQRVSFLYIPQFSAYSNVTSITATVRTKEPERLGIEAVVFAKDRKGTKPVFYSFPSEPVEAQPFLESPSAFKTSQWKNGVVVESIAEGLLPEGSYSHFTNKIPTSINNKGEVLYYTYEEELSTNQRVIIRHLRTSENHSLSFLDTHYNSSRSRQSGVFEIFNAGFVDNSILVFTGEGTLDNRDVLQFSAESKKRESVDPLSFAFQQKQVWYELSEEGWEPINMHGNKIIRRGEHFIFEHEGKVWYRQHGSPWTTPVEGIRNNADQYLELHTVSNDGNIIVYDSDNKVRLFDRRSKSHAVVGSATGSTDVWLTEDDSALLWQTNRGIHYADMQTLREHVLQFPEAETAYARFDISPSGNCAVIYRNSPPHAVYRITPKRE